MKKSLLILAFSLGGLCFSQTTYYVDPDATGNNDGSTWADAYTSLTQAVDSANFYGNSDVWIKSGTYVAQNQSANTFLEIFKGTHLYGGFDGSETNLNERDPLVNLTILDGDVLQDDVAPVSITNSFRSDNVKTVVTCQAMTTGTFRSLLIDGLTLTGGNANSLTTFDERRYGGAVYVRPATSGSSSTFNNVEIQNCIIQENSAVYHGGIYTVSTIQRPLLTLVENTIVRENSSRAGIIGTIADQFPAITLITNCLITGNTLEGEQGGTVSGLISSGSYSSTNQALAVVTNSTITENTYANNMIFTIFADQLPNGDTTLAWIELHNSIVNETSGDTLFKQYGAGTCYPIKLRNNLINNPQLLYSGSFANIEVSNNLVATSPGFVGGGDYQLEQGSAAIDLSQYVDYELFYNEAAINFTAPTIGLGGTMVPTSGAMNAGAYQGFVPSANLDEYQSTSLLTVYPNPVTENMTIKTQTNTSIQVLNSVGQVVIERELKKGVNQIESNHLNPGMYFIHDTSGNITKIIKK